MVFISFNRGLFLFLFFCVSAVLAQKQPIDISSGIHPTITHFSRNDFQADAQFWAMTRDEEGILYFGNNDGVMVFDGERWQKVVLPNNSSVRCIMTSKKGKVYAGGFNELGLIERDSLGSYRYNTLLDDLELEKGKLKNLWQVQEFKDHIIYRSFSHLIVITGNNVAQISSNNSFLYSDIVNNKFYVQETGNGLLEFDPVKMTQKLIFSSQKFENEEIKAILPSNMKDEIVLATKNGNIYRGNPITGELKFWLKIFEDDFKDQVISGLKYENNYFLGTLSSKILLLSEDGILERESPAFANMQNTSVLNLYRDGENIWALLNNGLDLIEFDSPVAHLFREASIYDILVDEKYIYLATNKGVFSSALSGSTNKAQNFDFQKIPNLEGQAWSLQKEGNDIIIGHDKGLFLLTNKVPRKIGNVDGFWKIIKIKNTENKFLAANYNGLYLLTKDNNQWVLQHQIKGFEESTRDILQTDRENTFWVCHGYKGVYKLKITNDFSRVYAVEHFTDQNGLQSPFNVNVTRWNEDIVFTTNTGIYEFNESTNHFEPYETLNRVLDRNYNTRKLMKEGNKVWLVQDDEIGYFNSNEQDPMINKNLFLNLKGSLNRGMESIRPLRDGKVLVGATTGLFLYDTEYNPQEKIPTKITKVAFLGGGDEKYLPVENPVQADLMTGKDIMRFEFAAPGMSPSSSAQYQYILDGIDEKWSSWENSAYKEYTHLPAGEYTFRVRSRDLTGKTGEEASFGFNIAPVWYRTSVAYLSYFILFILLAVLILFLIKQKIDNERKKSKVEALKSQKLLELQIEQLKLEKDKENIEKDKQMLEEDNIIKSKELANYTMMLVKKKDVFNETFTNLQEFKKSLKTQPAKKRLQEVLTTLNQHRIGEEFMTVFDVHFEKVHKNFFKELKNINPELTTRELRLCAFVKMNLSNKEIAPLLNISIRGVETARYRVRKKLNVQEVNFLTFLQNFSPEEEEVILHH